MNKLFSIDLEKHKITPDKCTHPEHEPPSHLYVPAGEKYIHKCPACGNERILVGTEFR